MTTKNIKLLLAFGFAMHAVQSPVQAEAPTIAQQTNRILTATSVTLFPALLALAWSTQYVNNTYLVQEEHLVKTSYPYAQEWYDAMAIKYPDAHLESKLFLQTMRHTPKQAVRGWFSTFNQIYFPQDSLKEINRLYKNKIDDKELTDEEQLTLCKEEFILLHKAGHIEHNDVFTTFVSIIGLTLGINGLYLLYKELTHDEEIFKYMPSTVDSNGNLTFSQNNVINLLGEYCLGQSQFIKGIIYTACLACVERNHEYAADQFSYTQCDTNALHGAVSFFEDEDHDPLYNIENKKVSPFLETDSIFGKIMQAWALRTDEKNLAQLRFIKSIPILNWFFHYQRDKAHPNPATRAQLIKNEIAQREKLTTQQIAA